MSFFSNSARFVAGAATATPLSSSSGAYVEARPRGGALAETKLVFAGELAVPATQDELIAEAERCARQLARAAGLDHYEPG